MAQKTDVTFHQDYSFSFSVFHELIFFSPCSNSRVAAATAEAAAATVDRLSWRNILFAITASFLLLLHKNFPRSCCPNPSCLVLYRNSHRCVIVTAVRWLIAIIVCIAIFSDPGLEIEGP